MLAAFLEELRAEEECASEPAASEGPTSVAHRAGGFSAADIADVLALERQVWEDVDVPHLSNHTRAFGEKTEHSRGHSVTWLHAHIGTTPEGRAVLAKLLALSMELEAEAGWGIASSGLFPKLNPRAVESMRYSNSDPIEGGGADDEIGWHSDFMSVMTVSVLLSPPLSFSGGSFQTRRLGPESFVSHQLEQGDVTVWKSWDRHRVEPLVGRRHVLVVQWWLAPAHTDPRLGPAPAYYFTESDEFLLPYCQAISDTVDPTSFFAAQICGKYVAQLAQAMAGQPGVTGPAEARRLYKLAMRYHERAAQLAEGSVMLRQPLLSQAECLSRIHLARGMRPELEHIRAILRLCERVHALGADLQPGSSPFDRAMAKGQPPVGQQKDMGGTVLRLLKQVVAVKALNLGTHASFGREFPFLKLYWG